MELITGQDYNLLDVTPYSMVNRYLYRTPRLHIPEDRNLNIIITCSRSLISDTRR
jgi:hypothetical protein